MPAVKVAKLKERGRKEERRRKIRKRIKKREGLRESERKKERRKIVVEDEELAIFNWRDDTLP